jgi:hypothetical protein
MNNTKYDIWNHEVRIVATRPIAIGDEITTSYGSTYWTRANDEIQVRVERSAKKRKGKKRSAKERKGKKCKTNKKAKKNKKGNKRRKT